MRVKIALVLLFDFSQNFYDDRLLLFLLTHIRLPCGDRRPRELEEFESLNLEEVEVSDSSVLPYFELQAGHLLCEGGSSGCFMPFFRGFN